MGLPRPDNRFVSDWSLMTSIESSESKPRKSALFRDPSADVVFESSDNVLFYIYRKHLDATTAGFAAPSMIPCDRIPVPLTESAEILEILFQFPSVIDMEIKTFFALAEAAEKYIVFSAMGTSITPIHELFPIEVLNHCAKHGYAELAGIAAHKSLSRPLDKIVQGLTHPGLLGKWVGFVFFNHKILPLHED
ncbi:hypothetical protein BYT27DRAFT_7251702 [Phlegmacium glaucopus]|nr:hypothetical protein BYT27DRAFT_7251702 [Phlegmacium glaucopus]